MFLLRRCKMDEILEEGARIVSTLAGSADDIHCSPCKSLSYGEVWAGRDTLGKIKESLQKNQRACHVSSKNIYYYSYNNNYNNVPYIIVKIPLRYRIPYSSKFSWHKNFVKRSKLAKVLIFVVKIS